MIHYISNTVLVHHTHLCSILFFKLVKVSPSVSKVRINLDGSLEPLSTLVDLPLRPEQPECECE